MKNNYHTVIIKEIRTETPKVKTFICNASIDAKPGQYIMVWIPGLNEKPFGVVDSSPLTISVANVGEFTQKIHKLNVGDKVSYRGPFGVPFIPKGNKILLVAGGYGYVPLYFLAKKLSETKSKSTVVIGARTKVDVPFADQFSALGCAVHICTDDGSLGSKGFTTQVVEKLLTTESYDSIYTCGPEIMMRKIAEVARAKNIFCQVSLERIFKCGGMGLCGACSINGILVCKDGPVFEGKILL
jgi:dihydroorotate dehydrogenase electron transfer subunit